MVLHQYQYLLWYCTFAVHTPPSSYTFSVTAGFITAMNISQTFKELHNCSKQQSWGFFTLAKSSQLRRICNNFRSQLSIFGGNLMAREILPAVGVLINFEALFKKQSTANCTKQDCSEWTAMWQQRCEQLYRTKKHWRECILIFNDDFLHSSVSWTQTGVTALSGPDNEWNLIFVWPEIGQAGQS